MSAMEAKKVVTCDIPRTFLQANWPEDNNCYLEFEALMIDMICKIDPCCKKYVITNKKTGTNKLY